MLFNTGQLLPLLCLFNLFDPLLEFHLRFVVSFEVALHLFVLLVGGLILELFLLGIIKSHHVPHRKLGSLGWTSDCLAFDRPVKIILLVEIESLTVSIMHGLVV